MAYFNNQHGMTQCSTFVEQQMLNRVSQTHAIAVQTSETLSRIKNIEKRPGSCSSIRPVLRRSQVRILPRTLTFVRCHATSFLLTGTRQLSAAVTLTADKYQNLLTQGILESHQYEKPEPEKTVFPLRDIEG